MAGKREDGGDEVLRSYLKVRGSLARAREEKEKEKARKREFLGLMNQMPEAGSLSIDWVRDGMAASLIEQCTTAYTSTIGTGNYVQWQGGGGGAQAGQLYQIANRSVGNYSLMGTHIHPSVPPHLAHLYAEADTIEERERLVDGRAYPGNPVMDEAQHAVPSWRDWDE